MNDDERKYLDLLKGHVVNVMRQTYPGTPEDMADWMVSDIANFQDDLAAKQHESVSTRWFYTHMKSDHKNLPRIDVLNILSRYAGYYDWADFKHKATRVEEVTEVSIEPQPVSDRSNRVFYIVPILLVIILAIFILLLELFHVDIF